MNASKLVLRTALTAMGLVASMSAHADSAFATGTTALTAAPSLDFKVIIPKILRFEVGSSTAGSVDLVEFDMTSAAAVVGDGSDIARTNATGAAVPVKLVGNGGAISVTGTTVGAMKNGTDTISYSEILPTSDNTALGSPILVDGAASAAISVAASSGTKVVNRTANWTFKYSNSAVVANGTYGGTVANNGRVTYTASMP